MKPSVYLETSVISYLTARLSRDLIVAAHQQITQEWWEDRRHEYDLYVSQFVLQEAANGNAEAANKRLEIIRDLPLLTASAEVFDLAGLLTTQGPLPETSDLDALHLAVASVSGMDFLLTWNNKHIANANMRPKIAAICRAHGFEPPTICNPEELMGGL